VNQHVTARTECALGYWLQQGHTQSLIERTLAPGDLNPD
jgi:hypothetical protein